MELKMKMRRAVAVLDEIAKIETATALPRARGPFSFTWAWGHTGTAQTRMLYRRGQSLDCPKCRKAKGQKEKENE